MLISKCTLVSASTLCACKNFFTSPTYFKIFEKSFKTTCLFTNSTKKYFNLGIIILVDFQKSLNLDKSKSPQKQLNGMIVLFSYIKCSIFKWIPGCESNQYGENCTDCNAKCTDCDITRGCVSCQGKFTGSECNLCLPGYMGNNCGMVLLLLFVQKSLLILKKQLFQKCYFHKSVLYLQLIVLWFH